jgi:hypothetical protein
MRSLFSRINNRRVDVVSGIATYTETRIDPVLKRVDRPRNFLRCWSILAALCIFSLAIGGALGLAMVCVLSIPSYVYTVASWLSIWAHCRRHREVC